MKFKKITNEEFHNRINSKNIISDNLYVNYKSIVKLKCLICNYEWETKAGNALRSGCKKCNSKITNQKRSNKPRLSQEKFLSKLSKKVLESITILGEYSSNLGKLQVQCNKCKRIWDSCPFYLYQDYKCQICARKEIGLKMRKTHEVFQNEINLFHGNDILLLEKYTKGQNKIKVKCSICEHEWCSIAENLLKRGCPNCNSPKTEKRIKRILEDLKFDFKVQYTIPELGKLRFDFAIFENNKLSLLIEYDGPQHYEAISYFGGNERLEKQKFNDNLKNNYCKNNNIPLVRIPFYDKNLINKNFISDIIKDNLNDNTNLKKGLSFER